MWQPPTSPLKGYKLCTVLVLLACLAAPQHAASQEVAQPTRRAYIVLMNDLPPAAAYKGRFEDYARTAPARRGQKLNCSEGAVVRYSDFLGHEHSHALQACGVNETHKLCSYSLVLNGFAAQLTDDEATALARLPNVGQVRLSRMMSKATTRTPDLLNLRNTLWRANSVKGPSGAGEGVVIGVIDSGIWPTHPSMSGSKGGRRYGPVSGWRGSCVGTRDFPKSSCNGKLIGAKYFVRGFQSSDSVDKGLDFVSPRDVDGHGTHTAATAAGNAGIPASLQSAGDLGLASGMAPRARVAVYKALWYSASNAGQQSGSEADVVAAVEEAVRDGVDIINFSISGGGGSPDFFDPIARAALNAARAGVLFVAAAGNSGPRAGSLQHISPWYLAVGASTIDRQMAHKVTLGSGAFFYGQSLTRGTIKSYPLISGESAALPGKKAVAAGQCLGGALDPAKVRGRVVVCKRNGSERLAKSAAVRAAGGAGMILANLSPADDIQADAHSLPAVHVSFSSGAAILKYIASTRRPTVTIGPLAISLTGVAGQVAPFSARGPVDATDASKYSGGRDILKPDMIAPGVGILAGYSPLADNKKGDLFAMLSGTSMAAPHVAGCAALIKQINPSWGPFRIMSALMTTASLSDSKKKPIAGNAFAVGSGFIKPPAAAYPGLVYDSSYSDYLAFLYSIDARQASLVGPRPSYSLEARNLNVPNFVLSNLRKTATVYRTVTSVNSRDEIYRAVISAPKGVTVQVQPSALTLKRGTKVKFKVVFTVKATSNNYVFGSLTWRGSYHIARSQIAVRPVKA